MFMYTKKRNVLSYILYMKNICTGIIIIAVHYYNMVYLERFEFIVFFSFHQNNS